MFTPTPPADDRPDAPEVRREPQPEPPPPWMIRRSRSQVGRIVWTSLIVGAGLALALGIAFGVVLHALRPDYERDFRFGVETQPLGYRVLLTTTALLPWTVLLMALAVSTQILTEAVARSSRRSARALARALGRRGRRRGRPLGRREWDRDPAVAQDERGDTAPPPHG